MPIEKLWVQGLQSDDEHDADWRRVLFARLTGKYLSIPRGIKTMAAEYGLFDGNGFSYFYVNACSPQFGYVLVAHAESAAATVTPFDTGGLWHNYISTSSLLRPPEKEALVKTHSHAVPDYEDAMHLWLDDAFGSRADYTDGVEPAVSAVPEIQIAGNTQRAWLWEGRLLRDDYDHPPCKPIAILMREEDAAAYMDWVETESPADETDRLVHLNDFAKLFLASDGPVADMNALIAEREAA